MTPPSGVTRETDGPVERVRLTVDDASLDIAPALGCCAVSWKVADWEHLALPLPLADFAASSKTGGVPLLYPFANRLRRDQFRWRDRDVCVAGAGGLKRDANQLPIHGFLLRFGDWSSIDSDSDRDTARCTATLRWAPPLPVFASFPFEHVLTIAYELRARSLRVITRVTPMCDAMPVAFGWHPYFHVPLATRDATGVMLPDREHIALDGQLLPVRKDATLVVAERLDAGESLLRDRSFDDLFRVRSDASCGVLRAPHGLTMELTGGYRFLQIFAPARAGLICFEPMVAPGAALSDGADLQEATRDRPFEAAFTVTSL
ncbi:MAG: aldose 1-epimerase [Phycisphaerae bacterium]|nr:aldose 1-epimerase [Phycisphaerae bacterium]